MTPELLPAITNSESAELVRLEKVIDIGISRHWDAWAALAKIQRDKLYRAEFTTFDTYVQERWGFARSYAYKLIQSSEVRERLSAIVDRIPEANGIDKPSQLERLASVPADDLESVVERAAVIASDTGSSITAKVIKQAKEELIGPSEPDLESTPSEAIPRDDDDGHAALEVASIIASLRAVIQQVEKLPNTTATQLVVHRRSAIVSQVNQAILLIEDGA